MILLLFISRLIQLTSQISVKYFCKENWLKQQKVDKNNLNPKIVFNSNFWVVFLSIKFMTFQFNFLVYVFLCYSVFTLIYHWGSKEIKTLFNSKATLLTQKYNSMLILYWQQSYFFKSIPADIILTWEINFTRTISLFYF